MKKDAKKNILDLRKKTKEKVLTERKDSVLVEPKIKNRKPKKRMKSLWVVLITAFLTTLIAGGGFAGFLYWQENFSKKETEREVVEEAKIEGQNIVFVTSNNEKLFVNFFNPENDSQVTKQIEVDTTISGGYWAKANKNLLIQFEEDGEHFIVLEIKEPSMSDSTEFAKFVRFSKDGSEKEVISEDKNYLAFGNFVYKDNFIYYLASNLGEDKSVISWDLASYNIKTKEKKILSENVSDFFEKEMILKGDIIESLYKKGSYIYKTSFDLKTGELSKKYLFRASYSLGFELEVEDVFVSPYENKYIYKDYSSWEGYSLKLYDEDVRSSKVLKKDKNNSFDNVLWLSKEDISCVKSSIFESLNENSQNQIIKININNQDKETEVKKSENLLESIIFGKNYELYFDNDKLIFKRQEEEKELKIMSLLGISDILFVGEFNYPVD